MEIFGKRPFVLKTAEMNAKIDDIANVQGSRYDDEVTQANKAIASARAWLTTVEKRAKIYKDAQTTAETVRKLLSKKTLSNADWEEIYENLENLGTVDYTAESGAVSTIYDDTTIADFNAAEIPTSFKRGVTPWATLKTATTQLTGPTKNRFITDSQTLEKNCREAKQKLKDMFEVVYKLTKSFVKDFEKKHAKIYRDFNKKLKKEKTCVLLDTQDLSDLTENYEQALTKYDIIT